MSPRALRAYYLRRAREAFMAARGWRRMGMHGRAVAWLGIAGDCRRYAITKGGDSQ